MTNGANHFWVFHYFGDFTITKTCWQTTETHLALSIKRDYFFIFISIFDFTMKESVLQLKEI